MDCLSSENGGPRQLSPLTLAFVGDAVYELLVRGRLARGGSRPVSELHRLAVRQVRCEAQARAAERLAPRFTEDEAEIFRRGKNAHPGHVPKNADNFIYHAATALEAVFGYLYLSGKVDRLRSLYRFLREEESGKGGDSDGSVRPAQSR